MWIQLYLGKSNNASCNMVDAASFLQWNLWSTLMHDTSKAKKQRQDRWEDNCIIWQTEANHQNGRWSDYEVIDEK